MVYDDARSEAGHGAAGHGAARSAFAPADRWDRQATWSD